MTRHYVRAADIVRDDIVLTANAEDPSRIYADQVCFTDEDIDHGWIYVHVDGGSFRWSPDHTVTVLRGL